MVLTLSGYEAFASPLPGSVIRTIGITFQNWVYSRAITATGFLTVSGQVADEIPNLALT